jgi:RHS repeat-associated protein
LFFGQTVNITATAMASCLAGQITAVAGSPVTASASGTTITMVARTAGAVTNYAFSFAQNWDSADFSGAPFSAPNGNLTNGSDAFPGITVYDKGTVTLTVNGFNAQACYGRSADCAAPPPGCPTGDSTSTQVACVLAAALNAVSSPVSATPSGATIVITEKTPGSSGNGVSVTSGSQSTQTQWTFSPPSFNGTNITLGGGLNTGDVANNPYVTQYQYDGLGNLARVDQKGSAAGDSTLWRTRLFAYDSLSRLISVNNPETGIIRYDYDPNGNVSHKTSPAPNALAGSTATQPLSYCYDQLNRVTGKAYSLQTCQGTQLPTGTAAVSYGYDAGLNGVSRLTSLIDLAGSASYNYDVMGRLKSETRTIGSVSKTLSYTYNLSGFPKTLTYPSNAVITYAPDAAGRSVSAKDNGSLINYVIGAAYQADGQPTLFTNGNTPTFTGISNVFSYNQRLQPINMSASYSGGTVFSIGYNFHVGNGTAGSGTDNGNVYGIFNFRDRNRDQTFTYDALNRVTSAQNTGSSCAVITVNNKTAFWGNSYSYDAWGNLTDKTITKCGAESLHVLVGGNNQITTGGYVYDIAGNLTSDPTDGDALVYDAENRIATATRSGITTTYTYDADGNRVRKSAGGTGTLYWYMTPGIVAESDLAGTLKSEYVFFEGKRVARRDLVAPTGVYYYFSDQLKSASVITDASGTIKADLDYYPWGGELEFVNNDSNHYKFTGKERDAESSLDYFGARYYSNALGRFASPDALLTTLRQEDPQTLNRYSYTLDNPLRYNDPTGLYEEDVHRDLTTVLAMAAGFDANTATQIGKEDQAVDEDNRNPYGIFTKEMREKYHFTTQERRDELWNDFDKSGTIRDLGTFLHAEQDSFSHQGFGPDSGHLSAGHAPDKTYNDPGKADKMAKDTYTKLSAAADKLGVSKDNRVAWEKIDKLVSKFDAAKTADEKKKILDQIKEVIKQAQDEEKRDKSKSKK